MNPTEELHLLHGMITLEADLATRMPV